MPASATAVIKGWADALRNGQTRRAAAYWAHPSAMINGPDAHGLLTLVRIRSEHDALAADATLSCGATLHSTTHSGVYVRAEFILSVRSGGGASARGCSGPASVDFLIRQGKIVRWIRAPLAATPPPGVPPGGESGVKGGAGQSV